jgi:hypothetical protein
MELKFVDNSKWSKCTIKSVIMFLSSRVKTIKPK